MRRVATIALLAASAGCAALGRQAFKQPHVDLRDVRVTAIGVTGGELEVALRVHNPNNYRDDANHLTYKVFVNDTVGLASGQLDSRSTVQAGDSTIISIPVAVPCFGARGVRRAVVHSRRVLV